MTRHHRPILRLLQFIVVVSLAVGVLGAASFLSVPRATASWDGVWRWNQQWVAGGYENWSGIGVQGTLVTHAPAVPGSGPQEYPHIPTEGAQSLARIAAVSPDGTQAIQAGWIVAPWHYGDSLPHLYVGMYFDIPQGGAGYCYGGFKSASDCAWVQISPTLSPGMVLTPFSQHTFELVYYEGFGGNWTVWLDSEIIGYIQAKSWPIHSFTQMGRAEWYGEVDANPAGASCADMGDGLYGTQDNATQMWSLAILDASENWHDAIVASSFVTSPPLYNVGAFHGTSFAYGGPGAGAC
jgi:hypothetical protein